MEPIQSFFDFKSLQENKNIEKVVEGFESIFAQMIIKEMRKSVEENSFSSRMYWDMFDMQLAQIIAQNDGLHLRDYFLNALKAYQSNLKSEE
ncbi:hypothetical protein JCM14244_03440 [Venenivibrio stagnispumantis]|uniref:Flagellar protein FlgJ n=1 Tax=Venenivibrio stagnispumantis TaxID=407998 RepID=A0AA45WM83_9AQUI|nr:rod-binding protein [Venenivibrio stagnispumantis]MCW4572808.1 rod-binding protein [Venenivibrio stagnispumantis]SMP13723.1 flagellar protein FlgJ [Venenivibrio stagnispumantis]